MMIDSEQLKAWLNNFAIVPESILNSDSDNDNDLKAHVCAMARLTLEKIAELEQKECGHLFDWYCPLGIEEALHLCGAQCPDAEGYCRKCKAKA